MSDELAKALRPFADEMKRRNFGADLGIDDWPIGGSGLRYKHLREALAALTAYEAQGGRRTAEETIEMLAQAHEMEKRVLYEALERALSHFAVMNSEQSARAASEIEAVLDRTCSVCGGDCASANPPVVHCPNARAALTAYEAHAKAPPSERETGWLIERKYPTNTIGATEPRWYAERVNGDHWWTPVPNDAKRFSSKNEAEAYPAYKMIASDPAISITEHVWLGKAPPSEAEKTLAELDARYAAGDLDQIGSMWGFVRSHIASLVKERDAAHAEAARMREALDFVETWICNPVSSYSVLALDGLFGMTRDRIAALKEKQK